MKDQDPASTEVQDQVKKLQSFITEHFYKCTKEILSSLGKMYAGGGEFTENIDNICIIHSKSVSPGEQIQQFLLRPSY